MRRRRRRPNPKRGKPGDGDGGGDGDGDGECDRNVAGDGDNDGGDGDDSKFVEPGRRDHAPNHYRTGTGRMSRKRGGATEARRPPKIASPYGKGGG